MISFEEACERVYNHRGPLAGAAETETYWLFSPSEPDPQYGPTFVAKDTGIVEQYDTNPRNWRPAIMHFRKQNPRQIPIPERFYGEPTDLGVED